MGNAEKRAGRPNRKTMVLPDVPRRDLLPAKRGPRHQPRYVVERWFTWFFRKGGDWSRVGAARELVEAKHLILRVHVYSRPETVRIIDTTTGHEVHRETLQPRMKA